LKLFGVNYLLILFFSGTKLFNRAINIPSIRKVSKLNCCKKKCTSLINQKDVKSLRTIYWSKKLNARNTWLLEKIWQRKKICSHFLKTDHETEVCDKDFQIIYGISKNCFYKIRKQFEQGSLASPVESRRKKSIKYVNAHNWLKDYAKAYGDQMPHLQEIVLPYRTRRVGVYLTYLNSHLHEGDFLLKKSTFLQMWKTELPYLKIKQVNYNHTKYKLTGGILFMQIFQSTYIRLAAPC